MNKVIQPQTYQARLTKKIQLASDVFEFEFELVEPQDIHFLPGQFINLKITDNNYRAYSISSSSKEKNKIQSVIKLIQDGLGSEYLRNLKINDEVEFIGSLGLFTLHENQNRKVFLATGTGIVPLKSMIDYLYDDPSSNIDDIEVKLIFGVRYIKDVLWLEYFKDLNNKHKNFSYEIMISKPESMLKEDFTKGRISEKLSEITIGDDLDIYVCGSGSMVNEVADYFLGKGIKSENIILEKFNNL